MYNYFENIHERIAFIEEYMRDIKNMTEAFVSGEISYTPEEADFWCDEFDEINAEWEKLVIQRSVLFNQDSKNQYSIFKT